jgi:tripartite-type tricarboxylate transporter receptor subunit TctC
MRVHCLTPFQALACAVMILLGSAAVAATPLHAADDYPSRHVRIVTNAGLGSTPDLLMRIVGEGLSRRWGQQLVIDNNSTGGGAVAVQQAADAVPDGYTLLLGSASAFTVLPERMERAATAKPERFKPVAFLGTSPMAIAASRTLGIGSLAELIALAKREPNRVFYAANATGSLPHMTGEHLKSRTGAPLTFVPYRGAADALTGVLSGQIGMIIENFATLEGAIQSDDLVLLGFSAKERLPNFPDVPTVGEVVPGFVAVGWAALMAPAGVPDAIVEKIHADVDHALAEPQIRQRLIGQGVYPDRMSIAALVRFIGEEQAVWRPVVRAILAAQRK